jgi:N-acetylmuramoyl-L-alanine amidase
MKRRTQLRYLVNCILLALAWPAAAATIDAVRIQPRSEATRIVVDLSSRVQFQVFTLEDPQRVVIDLEGAVPRSGIDVSKTSVGSSVVSRIRGAPQGPRGYRVVLDVAQRLSANGYMIASPDSRGDRLVVELRSSGAPAAPREFVAPRPPEPGAVTQRDVAPSIPPPNIAPSKTIPDNAAARSVVSESRGPRRDFIVSIDAGHGGQDPGAIGVGRVQEKRVALAIAIELARLFNNTSGFRGELTRKGDYYLTLRQRTTVARKQRADLFVSIHADAFTRPAARGASVYALSAKGATSETARWLAEKENASDLIGGAGDVSLDDKDALLAHVLLDLSMDANRSASIDTGASILAALGGMTQLHRRHVEQAGFVVLKSPDIPSILVETGYLSNPGEARKLAQSAYQRTIAKAIFRGITAYVARHPERGAALASHQFKGSAAQHVIKRGDTLSDIAARYQVTRVRLRQVNGLANDMIHVGQVLIIPPT